MAPGPGNPWILRPRPNPRAQLRLVCFPYAGGGGSVFRTWPSALPDNVELLAIELPGRETRFKERPFQQMPALIAALTDAVVPELVAPFAIYGHSLGALIAFCFARELRRRSHPEPVHLFVSGRRAPQLPNPPPVHHLPEPAFLDHIRLLGGSPEAVLQTPELMAIYLPILRADFALSETTAKPDEPLGCPITALGGVDDDKATLDELDAWRAQTSAAFDRETFPGGHFFLQQGARDAFLGSLSRRLARITASS